MLVAFHELGHFIVAYYYMFNISKIHILPFGIFIELLDYGMHPLSQELLLVIMGPLFSLLIMPLLTSELLKINYLILIYNLLPIYPLDGSKLLLMFLECFLDMQLSIKIQIRVSIFMMGVILIKYPNIGYLIVMIYLFYHNYLYIKEYRFIVIKTILNDHNNKKYSIINSHYKYYRPYNNYYLIKKEIMTIESIKTLLIKSIKND